MFTKFKRNLDIKKQNVSPLRKPPRLGSKKMKTSARLSCKKPK